jgi:uncharacterized membrane protein YraQ (UPF0718 family)
MKTENWIKTIGKLVQQSLDLDRKSSIEKTGNRIESACMLKGKSAGICQAINELKPTLKYMQSVIRFKRVMIYVLIGLLIIAGFVIYNQAKSITILQDYNEVVEQPDYNNFQD